jgi:anthranilate synthase/aminodeoxychorismate synthase-like glutamine amidotransferase
VEHELINDPKERAEHVMLIDLARNDIGRIAQIGTVKVTEAFAVERYSHVMHIVSNVEGILNEGMTNMDVLRATFPAGTLTGAPKVHAMELIDQLEPTKRGLYGGACGYLSFAGDMDVAIAIRTGIIKDQVLYVQAAAGVVADSRARAGMERDRGQGARPAAGGRTGRTRTGVTHGTCIKLLMIDNYDSFTYNIVQYFGELGAEVTVFRNDEITVEGMARACWPPGPAGDLARPVLAGRGRHFGGGHPALCRQAADSGCVPGAPEHWRGFGGKIVRAQQLMHGKTSVITTTQQGVFAGLPEQFTVNRYHSLAIERASCPVCLRSPPGPTTAKSWACATKRWTFEGVQFHPEIHPDRAWPRHAEELSGGAYDVSKGPVGGFAQRHRHPAHRRHARGHGWRRHWATTCLRRPQRQRAAGKNRQPCWALRPRCLCPPARRATCAPFSAIASAATNTSWARCSTATAGKAAVPPCSAACSRSRWPTRPMALAAGRHRGGHQARRRALCPHPAAGAGKHAGRQAAAIGLCAAGHRLAQQGLGRHLDGARLFNAAVAQAANQTAPTRGPRRGALPVALTACRSASARAWARRWARPCAAAANSLRGPTVFARWRAAACARRACWRRRHTHALDHHM